MALKTNLTKYAVDSVKEEDGVWQEWDEGISFCIRRLSSDIAQKAREDAEKPHVIKARNGNLSDEVKEDIGIRQLAFGIIADWKGITDENGQEIPYSGEAAYEIFKDDSLKDVRGFIVQTSLDRDLYKKEADEAALGN
jgi:hypothetical protein